MAAFFLLSEELLGGNGRAPKLGQNLLVKRHQRHIQLMRQGDKLAIISRATAGINQIYYSDGRNCMLKAIHHCFSVPHNNLRLRQRELLPTNVQRQNIAKFASP